MSTLSSDPRLSLPEDTNIGLMVGLSILAALAIVLIVYGIPAFWRARVQAGIAESYTTSVDQTESNSSEP